MSALSFGLCPSLLVTSQGCLLGLLLQGSWAPGWSPFMAHSPCALSKAGRHWRGLLLLGQEESEVVCQGSRLPAKAMVMSQPLKVGNVMVWSPSAHPSNLSTPAPTVPPPSPQEDAGCSGEPYCLSLARKLPHLKSLTPPTYLPLPLWHFSKLKVHSILKRETMVLDPAFPSSCSEPTS